MLPNPLLLVASLSILFLLFTTGSTACTKTTPALPPNASPLPMTMELMAYNSTNSLLGCITSSGNLTADLIWCYPFRTTTANGQETSTIGLGNMCSVDGGFLSCNGKGSAAEFYAINKNLAVGGVSMFSVDAIGSPTNTVGVTTYVGGAGAVVFNLKIQSVSG